MLHNLKQAILMCTVFTEVINQVRSIESLYCRLPEISWKKQVLRYQEPSNPFKMYIGSVNQAKIKEMHGHLVLPCIGNQRNNQKMMDTKCDCDDPRWSVFFSVFLTIMMSGKRWSKAELKLNKWAMGRLALSSKNIKSTLVWSYRPCGAAKAFDVPVMTITAKNSKACRLGHFKQPRL